VYINKRGDIMERWAIIKDEITLKEFNEITYGANRINYLIKEEFYSLLETAYVFDIDEQEHNVFVYVNDDIGILSYDYTAFDTLFLEIDNDDIENLEV
jgi:hypothetical protein